MTKIDELRVLCWQMHDAESPPTSSLHLHHSACKRMGTSDWSLLRVTSTAQAGGAALCSFAVAMAADKLLSRRNGSKYTVHLYYKHRDQKKKIGAFPSVKMNSAITCRNKGCGQSFIRRNHKRGLVLCKDVNGELLIDRLCLVLITLQWSDKVT